MYLIGMGWKRVDIWDYQSQQHLTTLASPSQYIPYTYSYSSDCGLLAIGNFAEALQVTVWDISNITDCKELPLLTVPTAVKGTSSMCFMTDSDHLIVCFGDNITLFDARSGSLLLQTTGVGCAGALTASVKLVHCFHDRFMTVSRDGSVQEWDQNLTEIRRRELGCVVNFASGTPSEHSIAILTNEYIYLLDLITGELTTALALAAQAVYSFQFNANMRRILVFSSNGARTSIYKAVSGEMLFPVNSKTHACFSPDGDCIFGNNSDGIFCLDAETGSPIPSQFSGLRVSAGAEYSNLFVLYSANIILM
jgi:WD40 repeat protein